MGMMAKKSKQRFDFINFEGVWSIRNAVIEAPSPRPSPPKEEREKLSAQAVWRGVRFAFTYAASYS
jgi:hypothetical protein